MADIQITCITFDGTKRTHENIASVGNISKKTKWTVEEVIQSIESKKHTFYVINTKTRARTTIGVIAPSSGKKYIRTYSNGIWDESLLLLPNCP